MTIAGTDLEAAGGRPRRALPSTLWEELVTHSPELMFVCDPDLVCWFASDSMQQITGGTPDAMVGFDLHIVIHREDHERVHEAIRELEARQRLGDTGFCELDIRVLFTDDRFHDVNLRGRLLTVEGERWLLITARDVTADRRNAAALLRKIELEALLEQVQQRFISVQVDDAGVAISWALEQLGRFLGANRAYLLEYDLVARTESMVHEWCSPDTEPDLDRYRDISFDLVPGAIARNLRGEISAVADVSALPDELAGERSFFESEGLKSILELPIAVNGQVMGNLGLDWTTRLATWTSDDLVVLNMFASTFARLAERQESDAVLADTLAQLRMAFEGSPVALALVDLDGRMVRVNPELCRLLGRDAHELVGASALELVAPSHQEACLQWGLGLMQSDSELPTIEARLAGSGDLWVSIEPRAVRDRTDDVVSFVIRLIDITETQRARAALRESESRFATLVDNLPDPVVRLARDGSPLFSNVAARRLQLDQNRLRGDDELQARFRSARLAAIETGTIQSMSYELIGTEGTRYLETRFVPETSQDRSVRSLLLVSTDLTDRRRSEAELAHRASHDGLTDLPNRHLFLSHLHIALDRLERAGDGMVAVVFFDLDRFKVVNDSLGHAAGDDLLRSAAHRLRSALRPDDVVARLGGDEFCVLLTNCQSVAQVMITAERLQGALGRGVEVAGRDLVVTASVGISVTATGKESPEELMAWADAAMYRAKESGRDRIHLFDDVLAGEVRERLDLDQRLRRAVELDEFEVWYQPELDLATGSVVGAEALLRWRSPSGVVGAAEFIGMAEETGLIVPIGWRVLHEACQTAARWEATGPDGSPLVIRVNLAARQLDDPDLITRVSDALYSSGLPASRLCLEITETALMANAAASRELLEELDELGVELAVDDFGTGYSSLSYLKQFPVDVLKIDRSFVDGLPDDGEDSAIVTTIIRLAESLGMEVTAEGIEHTAQAARLVELGCSRGQGFLYAKAMPCDELLHFLAQPPTPL